MTMAMSYHRTPPYYLFVSAGALLLVFLHLPPLATVQPLPWQLCNDTAGNYTANSAYQANIRRLAFTGRIVNSWCIIVRNQPSSLTGQLSGGPATLTSY
ncbi:unnamed protein product [Urochloa humidicola]